MLSMDMNGFYDKLGIRREFVVRGENALLFSDSGTFTDGQREQLQALLSDFYDRFVDKVASGRRLSDAEARALAEGRVWTGDQAVQQKLVDGLGGLIFPSKWQEQEHFYEPFTGTESWILLEQTVILPADGQCFVVGYHPDSEPGKLWVSVGRREEFGLFDILGMPAVVREVRTFHEVIGERLSLLTFLMVSLAYVLILVFILLGTWLLRTLAMLFRLL